MTGGGGASLEAVSRCSAFDAYAIGWSSSGGSSCDAPRPTTASQVYHFLLVSVNGSNVTVTPTDELGRTFDVQTYSLGGAPPPDVTPPSQPVVTGTPTATSVTLTWPRATDNVGVSRYDVSRDGVVVGTVGRPGSGTVSFTDAGRTPGTAYSYVVTASDAAGNSTASDAVVVTTTAAAGGGTTTLTTSADAKVDASVPTANYATAALRVDASPDVRSYVKFDASALTGTVQSATLRIWATSAQSVGFDVYGVGNSSWSENAITYANQPSSSISTTKLGSSGAVAAGTWKTVDVTALLSGPGVYSVVLESTSRPRSRWPAARTPPMRRSWSSQRRDARSRWRLGNAAVRSAALVTGWKRLILRLAVDEQALDRAEQAPRRGARRPGARGAGGSAATPPPPRQLLRRDRPPHSSIRRAGSPVTVASGSSRCSAQSRCRVARRAPGPRRRRSSRCR